MVPEIEEAIRRGAELLGQGRIREAQHEFYGASELSGKAPAVKTRIAEMWRLEGWAAVMKRNDPENGWHMFHNARAIHLSLGSPEPERVAEIERGMAIALSKMGEYEESLACCDRAEESTKREEELAKIWNARAISLSMLGRDDEAWKWAEKVLSSPNAGNQLRTARQSLGVLLIKKGRSREALDYLEDEVLRAWAHVEGGKYRQALKLKKSRRPRVYLIRARAWLGLGKRSRAMTELRMGAKVIEDGRAHLETEADRVAFQGAQQAIHALQTKLAAEGGRWREAFAKAEEARARSFLDFVVAGGRRDFSHLYGTEKSRFAVLQREMAEEERRGRSARLERLEHEFRMALRRYEKEQLAVARVQPRKPLDAAGLRRRLRKGEAIVEYHVADGAIYAFFLSASRFQGLALSCDAAELLEEVRGLSTTIALARREERAQRRGCFDWELGRLGEALLAEVPLQGIERLVVVPHGPLHRVPFAALRLGGKYLVERFSVTLAPSANVYVALAAESGPLPRRCLLVKDPTGTLAYADEEERELRTHFGNRLAVLAGSVATRAAVMTAASGAEVLHFATHAVFRPERSEFSYLGMAGGERLHATDILDLDLAKTRLVVLSACESGRGDFARADEMVGLPRAFLRAGVRSVLATLWPVEDHAAIGPFMKEFYAHLKESAAVATRKAQLAAISAGAPTSLWASFGLIGA